MLKGSLPEIFLDTDVAFDILSKRKPHYEDSIRILELAAEDRVALFIAESSLANLVYLSFDIYKLNDAEKRLLDFISACTIISGGKAVITKAISSPFRDKEDALQYYTTLKNEADYFITRNIRDYKKASKRLPVMTPIEFMGSL
ncbi:MAG TPA: PIN domain-containing protein [Balneolaceae bacterium]|nr:PIN domain-containing protein [Balneolaceae bacterium]